MEVFLTKITGRTIKKYIIDFVSEFFNFPRHKSVKYFSYIENNYFKYIHQKLAHGHPVRIKDDILSLVMDFERDIPFVSKTSRKGLLRSAYFPERVFHIIIEDKYGKLVSKDYLITPHSKFRYIYSEILNSDLVYKLM